MSRRTAREAAQKPPRKMPVIPKLVGVETLGLSEFNSNQPT